MLIIFQLFKPQISKRLSVWTSCAFIFIFAFMFANRDIDIASDTLVYKETYDQLNLSYLLGYGDYAFYGLMLFVKTIANFQFFLFLVALVYMGGAFLSFVKFFEGLAFVAFAIFLISPYFIQFGDNVIRNGMAASVFLLALSYNNRQRKKYMIMFVSCLIHSSMLLMCLFYYLSVRFKSLRPYLYIWLVLFVFSVCDVDMSNIVSFFLKFSNSYTAGFVDDANYQDFLIYGLPIVVMGFLIYKRGKLGNRLVYRMYLLGSCMQLISLTYAVMALRIAYFAGMLIPVALTPILVYYFRSKTMVLFIILTIFSIKAYKIFF